MTRRPVDLSSHLNDTVERGHPADFPVSLKPVAYLAGSAIQPIAKRLAVVRDDTGETLGVVSDKYALVPHQRILDVVQAAIAPLDVGPVPRGVYVDRGGARMGALYKFPALERAVAGSVTTVEREAASRPATASLAPTSVAITKPDVSNKTISVSSTEQQQPSRTTSSSAGGESRCSPSLAGTSGSTDVTSAPRPLNRSWRRRYARDHRPRCQ